MFMDQKQVQRIKEQYPAGTRIRLLSMDHHPVRLLLFPQLIMQR